MKQTLKIIDPLRYICLTAVVLLGLASIIGTSGGDGDGADNQPPRVSITEPSNDSTYTQGQTIDFSGRGHDQEDGVLTGNFLVWHSNQDGQIGTGAAFSYSGLSVGAHTITLTATDSAGATASDAITINIINIISGGGGGGESFTNSLHMTFNYIPPGTFLMGSPADDEIGSWSDETQHEVTLTQGYYMQTSEVTQSQWQAVMGNNPSYFSDCGNNCPVEQVSWEDVQEFITALNAMSEGVYRLPTEAEWEYAARAGSTTAFANGPITEINCDVDPNLDATGWYCGNSMVAYAECYDASRYDGSSCAGTHPWGQKAPNTWGLYDMHGNVWEWVSDWYGAYPAGGEMVVDPTGPASGSFRVHRGGSWFSYAQECRFANRFFNDPAYRDFTIGFRLAASAVP